MSSSSAQTGEGSGVIRVMLVDDSAVVRGLFARALETDPEIQVVASVGDGKMALSALKRHPVDLVVLDIEMPVMDGLTALPLMLTEQPDLPVLIASNLTLKNAEISMRALRAGAQDYIPKPSTTSELASGDHFKRELIEKIKVLVNTQRARRSDAVRDTSRATGATAKQQPSPTPATLLEAEVPVSRQATVTPRSNKGGPIALRPAMTDKPEAIAIGSSTGGPQALFTVLNALPESLYQPILITQHMPATFTTILAEHISRISGRACREAQDGETLMSSTIYVAPGDFHMVLDAQAGSGKVLRLLKTPQENFCRPSVDPMLRSLAPVYGRRLLVVMLTGMGQDGVSGSQIVVQNGGTVVAQDEATSVVWGMPGAVATAGLCSAVLPIQEIGPHILKVALRSAA